MINYSYHRNRFVQQYIVITRKLRHDERFGLRVFMRKRKPSRRGL